METGAISTRASTRSVTARSTAHTYYPALHPQSRRASNIAFFRKNPVTNDNVNRMRKLLYNAPEFIKSNFSWDNETVCYMTNIRIGRELCERLLELPGISSASVVTDAMAGIGGNTIAFAESFARCNSVELSPARCKSIEHNVSLFGLDNVTVHCGYFQQVGAYLRQDIVFFDPPWGLDYKKVNCMRVVVDGPTAPISLESLVIAYAARAKYCMVKLPRNYDFEYFTRRVSKYGDVILTREYTPPNSFVAKIIRYHSATTRSAQPLRV